MKIPQVLLIVTILICGGYIAICIITQSGFKEAFWVAVLGLLVSLGTYYRNLENHEKTG